MLRGKVKRKGNWCRLGWQRDRWKIERPLLKLCFCGMKETRVIVFELLSTMGDGYILSISTARLNLFRKRIILPVNVTMHRSKNKARDTSRERTIFAALRRPKHHQNGEIASASALCLPYSIDLVLSLIAIDSASLGWGARDNL